MKIALVSVSNRLTGEELEAMSNAIKIQLSRDICPAHGLAVPGWVFYDKMKDVKEDESAIVIGDRADVEGALGYHAEDLKAMPYGKVFVDLILDNGGSSIGDPNRPERSSISATLSHEVAELLFDPWCNGWSQGPVLPQGSLYGQELGDPVQDGQYFIGDVAASPIGVSNFVYPQWFNIGQTTKSPVYDKMCVLHAPFTRTPGGYFIVSNGRKETALMGEAMPEWLKELKTSEHSRFAQRARRAPGVTP